MQLDSSLLFLFLQIGLRNVHDSAEIMPQMKACQIFLQFTGAGLSNFYGRFCNDSVHDKPMIITETSAEYVPSNANGESDFQIKSNWWQQVFNVQGPTSNVSTFLELPHDD